MSLKSVFGTNRLLEIEGTWIDVLTNDDKTECRFKVSRMAINNRRFASSLAKKQKRLGSKMDTMGADKAQSEMMEVFVDTVLISWENVVDFREGAQDDVKDGEPLKKLPYSKENATWLLKQLPDLFDVLVKQASDIANFQAEEDEAKAKNSKPSSNEA